MSEQLEAKIRQHEGNEKILYAHLSTQKETVGELLGANGNLRASVMLLQGQLQDSNQEKEMLKMIVGDLEKKIAEFEKKISDDLLAKEAASIANELDSEGQASVDDGLDPDDYVA